MRLWLHILLKANWKDKSWRGKLIERGQLITSFQNLAEETGLSIQQIRTAFSKLESTGEVTRQSTNYFTLVTVCKYAEYQQKDNPNEQAKQQTNNKRITNDQQQLKKNKKENNNPPFVFSPLYENVNLSSDEWEKLKGKFGEKFAKACCEKLDNYKGASGKKYKSDYRAILNWVADQVKKDGVSMEKDILELSPEEQQQRLKKNMF